MFTGIVRGLLEVAEVSREEGILRYAIHFEPEMLNGLETGASVSVDGVCQTVVKIEKPLVWFDAIRETLERTTLNTLQNGQRVNVERAAKWGDEIGGHMLSGHIFGTGKIVRIEKPKNNYIVRVQCQAEWMKYIFQKGYIALDGVSLTLVDIDPIRATFTVHLIPETLRLTTFGLKKEGDKINIELDSQTQATVDTVHKVLQGLMFSQASDATSKK